MIGPFTKIVTVTKSLAKVFHGIKLFAHWWCFGKSRRSSKISPKTRACSWMWRQHRRQAFRFYADAPIKTRNGYLIGAIAVADFCDREFEEKHATVLQNFADMVMRELEIRRFSLHKINNLNARIKLQSLELTSTKKALFDSQKELDNFLYRASHDL